MAGRFGSILLTAAWLAVTASAARAVQDPEVESAARRLLAEGGYRTAFDAGRAEPVDRNPYSPAPRDIGGDGSSATTGVWVVIVAVVLVTLTVILALVFERMRRRRSGAAKSSAVKSTAVSVSAQAVPVPSDALDDDDPDALEAAGFAAESIHARLRRALHLAFAGRPPAPALTARAALAHLGGAFAARDALRDLVRLVEHARYAGFPVLAGHLAESRIALDRVVAAAGARR